MAVGQSVQVLSTPRNNFRLRDRRIGAITFGKIYPFYCRHVLPGDIFNLSTSLFVRAQPMKTPSLTPMKFTIRYFYVPTRLVEKDAELIITGSKDGKLYTGELPVLPTLETEDEAMTEDGSVYNWLYGVNELVYNYATKSSPAAWYYKAYCKIWWDFYRDENTTPFDDFDDWYENKAISRCYYDHPFDIRMPKSYLWSALPFQLKGAAPTIESSPVIGRIQNLGISNNFRTFFTNDSAALTRTASFTGAVTEGVTPFVSTDSSDPQVLFQNRNMALALSDWFNNQYRDSGGVGTPDVVVPGGVSFNAADWRAMMAQTRVFEQLARTGSRYTEYLRATFGTSPSDGTLQRAQYLGGFTQPLVTTEIAQTSPGDNQPVGTLKGHGISNGGGSNIHFTAKEFGCVIGVISVLPEIEMLTGMNRELMIKRRFDFYNPAFQHLSEQEVLNAELYIGSDGKNDDTFGFQEYGDEYRTGYTKVVDNMAKDLSVWTQAVDFDQRPVLSDRFLTASTYIDSFMRPFVYQDEKPFIIDITTFNNSFRPLSRFGTPRI